MRVAVLGPGGVGGLLAGVLEQAGTEVVVIARESTAAMIAERGLQVRSVMFGEMHAHVPARASLTEPVEVLIVATKAAGLDAALQRIDAEPELVAPMLNGLDHIELLRDRFAPASVLASAIRVEADRPEPGVIVHTSPFLLIDMATRYAAAGGRMEAFARTLSEAGIPVRVRSPISPRSEAEVMWAKLVRLNALACTTSAYDALLGEIRSTPQMYADLVAAIEESCVVGRAEGAQELDPATAIAELAAAHDTLGTSMQRDIAAGRTPELDAIAGALLRAAARHGIRCPTIERLSAIIAERAGIAPPVL